MSPPSAPPPVSLISRPRCLVFICSSRRLVSSLGYKTLIPQGHHAASALLPPHRSLMCRWCNRGDAEASGSHTDFRLSSHRDTMLPALSFLLTALSCVGGVTVVTQKPPVLTLTSGETATLDCNLGSVTNEAAQWYKQVPGGVPQFVIYHYHGHSGPRYGSGFSSPKFTSTHSTKSDYKLIISRVEVGDSAVYYCQTWDSTAKDYVSQ